jgi:hypothetical protein
MTLLEAISPTARELLSRIPGGGMTKFLMKNTKSGSHRTHLAINGSTPLCGGGNSARSVQLQEVFTEADCARCLAILKRRQHEPH